MQRTFFKISIGRVIFHREKMINNERPLVANTCFPNTTLNMLYNIIQLLDLPQLCLEQEQLMVPMAQHRATRHVPRQRIKWWMHSRWGDPDLGAQWAPCLKSTTLIACAWPRLSKYMRCIVANTKRSIFVSELTPPTFLRTVVHPVVLYLRHFCILNKVL